MKHILLPFEHIQKNLTSKFLLIPKKQMNLNIESRIISIQIELSHIFNNSLSIHDTTSIHQHHTFLLFLQDDISLTLLQPDVQLLKSEHHLKH